jgi:hypothetical protein
MKKALPLLLICSLALAGCGKKRPPVQAVTPDTTQAEPAQEAAPTGPAPAEAPPPPPAPAAPAQANTVQSVNGVVVPFLTAQLRAFIQEKGRLPETFGEFAGSRLDSVPRLQQGLTFVIDPATQEVKIVGK